MQPAMAIIAIINARIAPDTAKMPVTRVGIGRFLFSMSADL